jgi:hypothetical protein
LHHQNDQITMAVVPTAPASTAFESETEANDIDVEPEIPTSEISRDESNKTVVPTAPASMAFEWETEANDIDVEPEIPASEIS